LSLYLNGEEIIERVASIKEIIYTLARQNDKIPDTSPQISRRRGKELRENYKARIARECEPAAGIISLITSFFYIYGLVVSLCVPRGIIAIKIMTAPLIARRTDYSRGILT